jgi:hypothetical protein
MNTIALNQYRFLIEKYKWDWELGFCHALEFDACIPEFAEVSKDAYRAGYSYAMDWIIKHHKGRQFHPRIPLRGATKFKNQSITPIVNLNSNEL